MKFNKLGFFYYEHKIHDSCLYMLSIVVLRKKIITRKNRYRLVTYCSRFISNFYDSNVGFYATYH